jgi:hypothetical protein
MRAPRGGGGRSLWKMVLEPVGAIGNPGKTGTRFAVAVVVADGGGGFPREIVRERSASGGRMLRTRRQRTRGE